ncbi:hypothetical protein M407DRAFT_29532 [Tulasnella calospora MUT 4182]|uniref:Protein kinase domain-containing protein n=1 Tax=Tulasnella calospora MUT 4182 TaxID=1051891 RepID=A0A0C3KHC5_9AGAM|nr:hypothetical protein M407DRAFT_29532 [Tulasnella calospora MUT 4182]
MSENTNEKDEVCQPTTAEATAIDEGQGTMACLRICPRKVLASLYHLRIDGARIKPIESQTPKAGGKADVEAAMLTSGQSSSASEPEVPDYVAVKKLRFDIETNDDQALAPFAHELGLLNNLSHDNVVKIVGFVEDAENGVAWMVFLWEKNGNLREFATRIQIADVAEGLSYLHGRNPPICHGDLKSLNILVSSGNRAVITDFGSARFMDLATDAVVSGVIMAKATKRLHQTLMGTQKMEPLKAEVAESGGVHRNDGSSLDRSMGSPRTTGWSVA